MIDKKDIKTKRGMLYIANKDEVTYWFFNAADRDYFVSGGNIETKPGRDEANKYFVKRLEPKQATAGLPPAPDKDTPNTSHTKADIRELLESIELSVREIERKLNCL